MTEVVVYSRPGCHLCEDALAIVERVRAERPFRLTVIDIESDDGLLSRYLERIPVISVDGSERFQFFVDENEFRDTLGNLSRPGHGPTSSS